MSQEHLERLGFNLVSAKVQSMIGINKSGIGIAS